RGTTAGAGRGTAAPRGRRGAKEPAVDGTGRAIPTQSKRYTPPRPPGKDDRRERRERRLAAARGEAQTRASGSSSPKA
ncbi:MAG: hypothetical protein ACRDZQ_10650, partial [Acidimicrobiales bacterium]